MVDVETMTESELNGGGGAVFIVEGAAFTAGIKQSIRPPQPQLRLGPSFSRVGDVSGVFNCVSLVFYRFSLFSSQLLDEDDEDEDDDEDEESSLWGANGLRLTPLDVANHQVKAAHLDFDHTWFEPRPPSSKNQHLCGNFPPPSTYNEAHGDVKGDGSLYFFLEGEWS